MKEELKKSTEDLMTELQNTQEFVRYYNEDAQEFLKNELVNAGYPNVEIIKYGKSYEL